MCKGNLGLVRHVAWPITTLVSVALLATASARASELVVGHVELGQARVPLDRPGKRHNAVGTASRAM